MRITDLTFRGYGIFADCRLEGLPAGLCLFLGENEAGKSTCLGFVRDVLFGFPDGRSRERTYPALRGGRWGGSLGLRADDGSRLVVDRGPGSKGGRLSLIGPQGEAMPREALGRFLGGTTREVFKNVYAFSLSELQTLETLNSDRVKDAIYSAGLGAGLSSLPDILKGIEDRRSSLFRAGGQRQRINALLRKLEGLQAELGRASGEIETYDRTVSELESLAGENESLKEQLSGLRARQSQLSSLSSLWEAWVEREELLRELESLPGGEGFPADGLARYESLSGRLATLRERRGALAGELQSLQDRLDGLCIDEALLEREQTLRALAEEKSPFVEAKEELLRLEPEIASRAESLQAVARRLGGGWSRERIQGFDCSVQTKERISRFARDLQEQEKAVDRLAAALEDRRQELERADQALAAAEKELAALGPEEAAWDPELAAELRRDRDRFSQALEDAPGWRQEQDRGLRAVQGFLAEIDPAWDRADLEAFDTSLQVREHLEGFQKELAALDRELLQAEQEIRLGRDAVQELERKRRERIEALEQLPDVRCESLSRVREAWTDLKRLRQRAAERENAQVRARGLQDRIVGLERELAAFPVVAPGRLGLMRASLAGLAGACLLLTGALALGGILTGLAVWGLAGASAVSALGTWLAHRGVRRRADRQARIKQQRDEAEKELRTLQAELGRAEEEWQGLDGELDRIRERLGLGPEGEEALELELERATEVLHRRGRIQEELEALEAELGTASEKLEGLKRHCQELEQRRASLWASWQDALEGLGLRREIEPAAVLRLIDRVETARSELDRLKEAERRLGALDAFLEAYAAKARQLQESRGLPPDSLGQLLSAVDRHLERLDREAERARKRESAQREQDRLAEERSRLEAERERTARELQEAEKALSSRRAAWSEWLQEAGLDPELPPDVAREAVADIERAQRLVEEQRALEEKREQHRRRVADLVARTRELARALGRSEPEERLVVPWIETLRQELEASRADRERRRELTEQYQEKEKALEEADAGIEQVRRDLAELLAQAGAEDEDTFLATGKLLERKRQIQERVQDLERSLLRGVGVSHPSEAVELFSAWSKPGLQEELSRLEQDIEELEARRQEVSGRIGELRSEKSRLASADDVSRIRQEQESLREELHTAALRWSRDTLALHLLRQAKERYEQEQQPQVVQTAGRYLAKITGGVYDRVFAPLGESEVYAVEAAGQPKRPEELSRGTAEQLYLSLRFGYVDNAGRQGERLPVIMDDILVNFDRNRAGRAAAAIAELAKRNQVLYFTCHAHTLELFSRVAPETPVFELKDGDIRQREER